MTARPGTSIVLPCFNEGSRIAASLATLESWFGDGVEVLVVDDGSADDTVEQARAFAARHSNVRVHSLTRNRGKGLAVRTAVPLVRGESVVVMDADLAFDRGSVERVLNGLAAADVVIGNRRHHDSYYSVPVRLFGFLYRRHVVGLLFNALVRFLLGLTERDTQCGLKAYRRTALERIAPALTSEGFALDVEILLVTKALGLRLTEVPVRVTYISAKSSVTLLLSGWVVASDLLRIAVRRLNGRYTAAHVGRP